MAQHGARTVLFATLFSSAFWACGPGAVEIRATATCEGGNVADCKDRCGKNEGLACYKLGWLNERGREVEGDFQTALKLYQQACDADWPQACRALGDLNWRGDRIERNRKKALEYWSRACGLGLEVACPTALERDIADGKLIAVPKGDGTLSITPNLSKRATSPTSEGPSPSAAEAPSPAP